MDNKFYDEAKKITNKLIKMNNSKKGFNEIFYELLDKKYIENEIQILSFIPTLLAEENYIIESFKPFKLNKK